MELQHFSHLHPLILGEVNNYGYGGKTIFCQGCCQNISGSAYSCRCCSFSLHKLCAELPAEIEHPFHEMDPLRFEQPQYSTVCLFCGFRVYGFTYSCSSFSVDIRCIVRSQHFSHKHQLILLHQNEEKNSDDGDRVSCDGCLQPIRGSAAYRCTICSIYLHKWCGELPAEMQYQMHPQHPLTLLPTVPSKFRCDCCCNAYSKALFTYRCTLCNFNLDISCALRALSVKHESHNHPLSLIPSSASFDCHACRTKREDISYMCNTCNFWIHESCASLPTPFQHNSHVHRLSLIYSIPEESTLFNWSRCGVCDKKLLRGSFCWFYACHGCQYYIHVNCSSKTKERKIAIKVKDIDKANLIHLPMSDDQSVNLIDQFVKQISLRDIKNEVKDNYFGHDHPLILFDAQGDNNLCSRNELIILNEQKNKKICNACVRQISVPFYSCSLCDFFLHKWCAELPNELEHPCHQQHQLILLKKCPENRGLFWSECCRNDCNGFAFKCVECKDYCLDVKCACLPSSIIHKIHDCQLFLRENCIAEGCVACPRRIQMFSFGCDTCNIYLHYTCALLPHTISHRYDKHPFTLIYAPIENGSEEYICEFCEVEIDPKWWFYHCIHCDQSACAKCIYKEEDQYPTIKWRIPNDSQSHPLVLVEATDKTARCDHCHESYEYSLFDRLAFKCEQCDIMLHSDCPHPDINSSLE